MPADKPTELSRIKLKNLNSTAREFAPKNATPMTCPWLHWTTDNLSGMHMVSISTPVCVNFELGPGAGDIHICWFNFDALAQGNAYKPTKEPINYRGPGGDRTHDLQTENIHTYIHTYLLLLISMLWHRQAIFESKGDKLSSSAESRIRTWKSQGT